MPTAFFDCFAGSGGDMIVAALLDAGADLNALRAEVARLGLEGVELAVENVRRGGLAGVRFVVREHGRDADEHHHEHREHRESHHRHHHTHRSLTEILELIRTAGLPDRAADRAQRVFRRLGAAEAAVHGVDVEAVHFHEVGAVDSIVDVVAACVALELLNVDRVLCSPIAVGSGQIECAHGTLPVPAPATARLLVGAATQQSPAAGEATTPTAAAVLTTLAEGYGPPPAMRIDAIGHGAGTRDGEAVPNILRVFLGDQRADATGETLVELAANIDDATGEMLGSAIERLLDAGCLDAWATPIVMKKSRPAWTLSALCAPADADEAQRLLFAETTTFGVRRHTCNRIALARRHETVETPYGPVRVKIGTGGDGLRTVSPEFADCQAAARSHHVAVREVLAAALAAHRDGEAGDRS